MNLQEVFSFQRQLMLQSHIHVWNQMFHCHSVSCTLHTHINTHTLKRTKSILCSKIFTQKSRSDTSTLRIQYTYEYINSTFALNTYAKHINIHIHICLYTNVQIYTLQWKHTNIDAKFRMNRKIRYKRMTDILSSSNSICPVHLFSGITNTYVCHIGCNRDSDFIFMLRSFHFLLFRRKV